MAAASAIFLRDSGRLEKASDCRKGTLIPLLSWLFATKSTEASVRAYSGRKLGDLYSKARPSLPNPYLTLVFPLTNLCSWRHFQTARVDV
jgi:hypothetical protein